MYFAIMDIHEHAAHELELRKQSNSYRIRRQISSPQGAEIKCNAGTFLNFCSNDYLGLANHKDIVSALKRGADLYGAGSGASHVVCGHSKAHSELEESLANFVCRKRALLFSTGYMANLAMVNVFLDRNDEVFADRLNHASMIDAANLSRAKLKRYAHCSSQALAKALAQSKANRKLVLTDGVFSMDGDIAPLPELVKACKKSKAWLGVDDAHGFGVLGSAGTGILEHFGLSEKEVPLLMATLGKAAGCFGAFVAGDDDVIDILLQSARPYLYTTAPPPALAVASIKALEIMQTENWRRDHLQILINRFRKGAKELKLSIGDSITPIQPLIVGSNKNALLASQALFEKGILITAIRPPTVPKGTSRLRITLSAAHTEEQIDRLLDALSKCIVNAAD
jgi:8-amino-7-oxononanoate synthase